MDPAILRAIRPMNDPLILQAIGPKIYGTYDLSNKPMPTLKQMASPLEAGVVTIIINIYQLTSLVTFALG